MKLALALVALLAAVCAASAADPEKPVWPIQFDVPFGLNWVGGLLIKNASSHLYYNWDLQAQVVQYDTHCFPLAHWDAVFFPCKLYFNPTGIYFSQPANKIDCCLFEAGVGSVPPAFLSGFTYSGSNETVQDMYGNNRYTYKWSGPDGFGYWTDAVTEEDVQFQDGPTGVHWNFGTFNVVNQSSTIFDLPSGNCNTKCNFLFAEDATASGFAKKTLIDPLYRIARLLN